MKIFDPIGEAIRRAETATELAALRHSLWKNCTADSAQNKRADSAQNERTAEDSAQNKRADSAQNERTAEDSAQNERADSAQNERADSAQNERTAEDSAQPRTAAVLAALDRRFVNAAVHRILTSPPMMRQVRDNPAALIPVAFDIVDKHRRTVPFFPNEVQTDFLEKLEKCGTAKPFFILKGRQQGFTSLITALQLAHAIVRRNFAGFTVSNSAENTAAIFNDKARALYDRLPDALRPTEKFNSQRELFFSKLNSSWRVATASDTVGRSRTLSFVHFSEVAFFDCSLAAMQAGVGEALTDGALCVYETTANGFNAAKELWDSGACENLFYGWWRSPEYRSVRFEALASPDRWLAARLHTLSQMGLSREQLAWYANKYNSYLDKTLIRQEYPVTPEEAFRSTGDCLFDAEALSNRLIAVAKDRPQRGFFRYRRICEPIKNAAGETVDFTYSLADIAFTDAPDGCITLHEMPRTQRDSGGNPVAVAPYALGGDTAGSGKDYFTGKVICALDGRTAATLRARRMDEDLYAEQMLCLAKFYHDATVGIETNYSFHPMRVIAEKYNYKNLYKRERVDIVTRKTEDVIGFETTVKTKPVIISELVCRLRTDPTLEPDRETLRELTTFVRKDNGRMEAAGGAHDDLVMALAIAHHVAGQLPHDFVPICPPTDEFLTRNFPATQTNHGFWEEKP